MDWDIVAVVAAGLSVFLAVLAVAWPRRVSMNGAAQSHFNITGWETRGIEEDMQRASEIVQAVHRRGRHLRTD